MSVTYHKPKLLALQCLRAIAATAIFVGHAFTELGAIGSWGVSVFLVLSGFVMCYAYYDRNLQIKTAKDIARFSFGKIKDLYILHAAIILLVYAALPVIKQILNKNPIHLSLPQLAVNLLLIKVWFPQKSIYFSMGGVSWYLCVILILYAFFPALLKAVKRYRSVRQAWFSVLAVYAVQFLLAWIVSGLPVPESISDNFPKWFTYVFPLYRLGDFFIGCSLGYIFLKKREPGEKHGGFQSSLIEGLIVLVTCALLAAKINQIGLLGETWFNSNLVWLPVSCAIIYFFAENKGWLSRFLCKSKLLVLIGDISAYTFLIHIHVIHFMNAVRPSFDRYGILTAAVGFAVTQAVGYLIYAVFKKVKTIAREGK